MLPNETPASRAMSRTVVSSYPRSRNERNAASRMRSRVRSPLVASELNMFRFLRDAARSAMPRTVRSPVRTRQMRSRAEESLECGAAAGEGCAAEDAVVVWSLEEVLAAFSADAPGVVVHVEVAEPAQEYAVVDVGAASVFVPVVDVVGFAPGWGSCAEDASAVAGCHDGALLLGEEALLAAEVEGASVGVEQDRYGTAAADVAFGGGDGDGVVLAFEVGGADPGAVGVGFGIEVGLGDEDADGGFAVAEECSVVDACAE